MRDSPAARPEEAAMLGVREENRGDEADNEQSALLRTDGSSSGSGRHSHAGSHEDQPRMRSPAGSPAGPLSPRTLSPRTLSPRGPAQGVPVVTLSPGMALPPSLDASAIPGPSHQASPDRPPLGHGVPIPAGSQVVSTSYTTTVTATTIAMPTQIMATGYVAGQPLGASPFYGLEAGTLGLRYPDLPDPALYWRMQHATMFSWLIASVLCLLLFMAMDMGTGVFIMAEFAAVLGIVGASSYVCQGCSGGADLAAQVRAAHVLGMVAVVLDCFTLVMVDGLLVQYAVECSSSDTEYSSCRAAWGYAGFLTVILGGHAALSLQVGQRARQVQMLLNPVSSGLMSLD